MNQPSLNWILAKLNRPQGSDPSVVAAAMTQHSFSRRDRVYNVGEEANFIYLIATGHVKLGSVSDDGRAIIKAILGPGDVFGMMTLVGDTHRRNFAEAMDEELQLYQIPLGSWQDQMEQDSAFCNYMMQQLGSRLLQTEKRIESLVFKDARTRIVDFLLGMAGDLECVPGVGVVLQNFLTHQDIASLTATSRQTVTSILNELRDQGKIWFDRKEMRILDLVGCSLN